MEVDLQDVKGIEHAKRAIEVAASGNHTIKLSGPPGSGKSLLARAAYGLLPAMNSEQCTAVTTVYRDAGLVQDQDITRRPFCAPHFSAPISALLGNAKQVGMLRLAQHGVLLLDHAPEFGHKLNAMVQAIELAELTHALTGTEPPIQNTFIVFTQQPCLCGWHGDAERMCTCTPSAIARYQARIPSSLQDGIDIRIDVGRVAYEKLSSERRGEPSSFVRDRVQAARERQWERFGGPKLNTSMTLAEVREHCSIDMAGQSLMKAAVRQLQLTARTYQNVLKLSRTIADLAGTKAIAPAHLAEAFQYRPR